MDRSLDLASGRHEARLEKGERVMDDNMKFLGLPIGLGIVIGLVVGAVIGGSTAIGLGITTPTIVR